MEGTRSVLAFAPLVVGIGGSQREGSCSELALRVVLAHVSRLGAKTEIFAGADLDLPFYSPQTSRREERAIHLVEGLRRAQGVILASPAYHGSVSGLIKNALDYVEDLRNDPNVYLDGRAVGCIAVGQGSQATVSTLATLRSIVHALRGWPTPLGVCINGPAFDSDGSCTDVLLSGQLKTMAAQIVEMASIRYGRSQALTA